MKKLIAFFVGCLFASLAFAQPITNPFYNPIPSGGINGQFLQTNGAGVLSWATVSAGCSAGQACTGTTITATTAFVAGSNTDAYISRCGAKLILISGDGIGATTNAGWCMGYQGNSGNSALYSSTVIPGPTNHVLYSNNGSTDVELNAASGVVNITTAGSIQLQIPHTASANHYITITGSNGGNPVLNTNAGSFSFGSTAVTPASTGVRFLCISTTGVVTSQAAACVGT